MRIYMLSVADRMQQANFGLFSIHKSRRHQHTKSQKQH